MPTVYITTPRADADEIASRLVEARLAACVNRVDCQSTYRWEGAVHEDDESILFVKTTEDAYDRLVDRVLALHPYDVPCIERIDEADVLDAYADWVHEEVDEGTESS